MINLYFLLFRSALYFHLFIDCERAPALLRRGRRINDNKQSNETDRFAYHLIPRSLNACLLIFSFCAVPSSSFHHK